MILLEVEIIHIKYKLEDDRKYLSPEVTGSLLRTSAILDEFFFFFFFVFFFFFLLLLLLLLLLFLGPLPRHMEVPRLGVELEL